MEFISSSSVSDCINCSIAIHKRDPSIFPGLISLKWLFEIVFVSYISHIHLYYLSCFLLFAICCDHYNPLFCSVSGGRASDKIFRGFILHVGKLPFPVPNCFTFQPRKFWHFAVYLLAL